ncbi:MAG: two-component system response regulator [Microvirga sp.]|nr:two-component system response regulator [Microvirga sp.]
MLRKYQLIAQVGTAVRNAIYLNDLPAWRRLPARSCSTFFSLLIRGKEIMRVFEVRMGVRSGKLIVVKAHSDLPSSGTSRSCAMSPPAPIRTLIVGEHSSLADMLDAALGQLQLGPVEHVGSGAAALVKIRERSYDLFISDWFTKPVRGLQLLKFVRAEPALASVRFIISVPLSEPSGEVAAKEAGADGLLVEPHSLESLMATIRSVLRRDEQV